MSDSTKIKRLSDKTLVHRLLLVLNLCIELFGNDGKRVLDSILPYITRTQTYSTCILVTDHSQSRNSILLEKILSASTNHSYAIISFWKDVKKDIETLIHECCGTVELKAKHFLLLIDDIQDSSDCFSFLSSRDKLPPGVTVSVVAVCYTNQPKQIQQYSWSHCLNITNFGIKVSAKRTDNIIVEYLETYDVGYENLLNDSIVVGFGEVQLREQPKTLTQLISQVIQNQLTNCLKSSNEKGPIYDLMCIEYLDKMLRKQPTGKLFDVSLILNRVLIDHDNSKGLKCCEKDSLFSNAAVQDLMAARGIQLLPIASQIKILTTCIISKSVCGFYGGLSCPELCVSSFNAPMFAMCEIFEGIYLKRSNDAECVLCLIQFLYQVQESNLCIQLVEICIDVFTNGVEFKSITYCDIAALSYFVQACSRISSWDVTVQKDIHCTLFQSCRVQLGKVTSLKLIEYSKIKKRKAVDSLNMTQRLASRTASEIILKLLQFISPVPVVCSSKNPGYASFVSCRCFKEAVLSRIQFSPTIPTHWVPGDAKYSRQLNTLHTDHTEVHGPELLEYVVLLAPLPSSIQCILPTSEVIVVHIDSEQIDMCTSEGSVVEAVQRAKIEECTCTCEKEKSFDSNRTLAVYPCYILTKILNEKS